MPGPAPRNKAPQIATLLYHEVTDDPASSGFQRASALPYKHGVAEFRRHLDLIAAAPCAPELVTAIDLARPGRHLLLTFDDGGKSALAIGDELTARGWRGHFFVTTGRLGDRTFLSGAEVRRLHRQGHLVGSHSHSHPEIFCDLPRRAMVEEWRASREVVADLLGEPCIAASVPGGDLSGAVLRSAAEAGLEYLFTSEPWLAPRRAGGCWVLGRVCPKVGTPLDRVGAYLAFAGWRRAAFERRGKQLVKKALFPLYRLYVRIRLHERAPP